MTASKQEAFDLSRTYAFLEDGGAAPPVGAERFWKEVMSGKAVSEDVLRVANGSGWLVARYKIAADTPNWERHPAGDELLVMLTCEMTVVLDQGGKETAVDLAAGQAFVVPRGTWHRQVMRKVGEYLGATFGKGTEHRPR